MAGGTCASVCLAAVMTTLAAAPALAAVPGDFNGDGRSDLAMDVRGQDVGPKFDAGAVIVVYSGQSGLVPSDSKMLTEDTRGVRDKPEEQDNLGTALAAGDFDGDGRSDLAIGVSSEQKGGLTATGAVQVLYGSAKGLRGKGSARFTQDTPGIADHGEQGDHFAAALASGDFNGDGRDDLAIGASLHELQSNTGDCNPLSGEDSNAGAVHVLFGSSKGIRAKGDQFAQDSDIEDSDCFGSALASGDFNDNGRDELVVGVGFEDSAGDADHGLARVFQGRKSGVGFTGGGSHTWGQQLSIAGARDAGELFGSALATGDISGDGIDDLAVGVSGDVVGGDVRAGGVNVLYGSPGGEGLTNVGNQLITQDFGAVEDIAEPDDRFGIDVAIGRFDAGQSGDLAVGAGREDFGGAVRTGVVHAIYGSGAGLTDAGDGLFDLTSFTGLDVTEARFGSHLATGRFGDDKRWDLAMSAHGLDVGGLGQAGGVGIVAGTASGLVVPPATLFTQAVVGIPGDLAEGTRVGYAVAP